MFFPSIQLLHLINFMFKFYLDTKRLEKSPFTKTFIKNHISTLSKMYSTFFARKRNNILNETPMYFKCL